MGGISIYTYRGPRSKICSCTVECSTSTCKLSKDCKSIVKIRQRGRAEKSFTVPSLKALLIRHYDETENGHVVPGRNFFGPFDQGWSSKRSCTSRIRSRYYVQHRPSQCGRRKLV